MKINRENILEYARRYDAHYKDTSDRRIEEKMKNLLKKQRYLTKDNLTEIAIWKAGPRIRRHCTKNNDLFVREITKFSFSTKNEEARIKSLIVLDGVFYPVASTILHFAFPGRYPIMDFRAIWSLGWKQPKIYDFNFWQKYCNETRKISKKLKLSLRVIDKALWQYSKEKQK